MMIRHEIENDGSDDAEENPFVGDKFLNLNLPLKFDLCSSGSCEICCDVCRYDFVYDDGDDEGTIDVVDQEVFQSLSVSNYYNGDEDVITMVEESQEQLYNEAKVVDFRRIHDTFWEDFIVRDMRRKPLNRSFQYDLNYFYSIPNYEYEVIQKHYPKLDIRKIEED
ncbi:hypothetical protein DVH24_018887 [Malus domestica]|uniref:Uncharacterized protein n=1 Tax=Malus domestica TaxID=3750 RepID=A0A498HNR0_MALDO|nr:hypothetical protein DVH24_018887 [Malus domestica]